MLFLGNYLFVLGEKNNLWYFLFNHGLLFLFWVSFFMNSKDTPNWIRNSLFTLHNAKYNKNKLWSSNKNNFDTLSTIKFFMTFME